MRSASSRRRRCRPGLLTQGGQGGHPAPLPWRFRRNSIRFPLNLHTIHWKLTTISPLANQELLPQVQAALAPTGLFDQLDLVVVSPVRARPGQLGALSVSRSKSVWFCMALLYGRAGCLTAQNGGFRPPPPGAVHPRPRDRGRRRARSHCRFVPPLIHFIPDLLRESVPLFLKRQCDRMLGRRARPRGPADPDGGARVVSDCRFRKQLLKVLVNLVL
jgi:hypothetical protein